MTRRPPLLALPLLFAVAAQAQPEPERLPDLTPQEFEIVGEVRVDLPQIERQPLSGFGPPPRTYTVPAEREPARTPYGPDLAPLPAPALAPPTAPALTPPDARRGRVEGGFGRYTARYGRLDLALPAGPGLAVADVDYDGLGEVRTLEPGDEGDEYVTFSRLAGRAGWQGRGPVRLGLDGGLLRQTLRPPGFGLSVGRRFVRGFDGEARLEGGEAYGAPFAVAARAGRTRLSDRDASNDSSTDTRLDGDARLDVLNRRLRLEGAAGTSLLGGTLDGTVTHYAAGAAVRLGTVRGARLEVGARLLGYEASAETGRSGSSQTVAPTVNVEVPFGPNGRLFARTAGRLVPRGLAELVAENPFVVVDPALAPDVRLVDAAAGLELRSGPLGLRVAAEGTVEPTRLFYEGGAGGPFEASYGRARTLGVAGDVTLAAGGGVEASAGAAFRHGRLTELDGPIPYFAPFSGQAGVQVPFDAGRGRVGLAGAFEGPRPADRLDSRSLPAWGSLTLDGAYTVRAGLAVTLRAQQLLGDAERWEGLPQAPFTVVAGARYVFD